MTRQILSRWVENEKYTNVDPFAKKMQLFCIVSSTDHFFVISMGWFRTPILLSGKLALSKTKTTVDFSALIFSIINENIIFRLQYYSRPQTQSMKKKSQRKESNVYSQMGIQKNERRESREKHKNKKIGTIIVPILTPAVVTLLSVRVMEKTRPPLAGGCWRRERWWGRQNIIPITLTPPGKTVVGSKKKNVWKLSGSTRTNNWWD